VTELPQSWTSFNLELIGSTVGGKTPSKSISEFWSPGEVHWASPKDMKSFVLSDTEDKISRRAVRAAGMQLLPRGTVLVVTRSGILAHTLPVAVTSIETTINQDIKAVLPQSNLHGPYLAYAIRANADEILHKCTKQGTTVASVETALLEKFNLPLAPLNEQKRIVDKLDALLARVDACRKRLDRVPAILKRFRQAVLAAATSGKLTEEWRNLPGESICSVRVTDPYSHTVFAPESWRKTTFEEVCDLIGGSQPPKSTFVTEESDEVVRLIQIRDYKSDKFKVFIPRNLARRFCNKTDVMIGRYGPPIFQILRGLEGAYNVALMKAELKSDELERDYLFYWLKGETLLRYVESASDRTAGQDGVRKELLNPYPFFLPPKNEQHEIVHRAEALFAYADRIEARYAAAHAQVERLTPSLLAKTFCGELVPQDPNDEPASVLLERIRASRTAAGKKPSRKVRTERKPLATTLTTG
jgi:type I restriction enzyme S subunit